MYLHCGPSAKVNHVAQKLKSAEKDDDAYSLKSKTNLKRAIRIFKFLEVP